ncbi:MAG TPA: amino acid adenylation domain-containing protein [Pyrinomonadaceae bacterium]|nr:amino acid adenylation domain-containing protein [Pyrinomonadaceae bacterium]
MASVFDHLKSEPAGPPVAASEAKRLLIEKYLRGDGLTQTDQSLSSIPPRAATAPLHLSFAQERLWFIDQLMPGSPAFNVPMAVKLSGSLNIEALQRAVDAIVRRHESLRTTFVTLDGAPSTTIVERCNSKIEIVDLTSTDKPARERESRHLIEQEILKPFRLDHGPLIRAKLIQCGPHESIFIVTMHHIVSDGWSLILFFKELSTLYDAFVTGTAATLEPLSIQYADYAEWQRRWLRDDVVTAQLSYWKQQLSGELPVLDLPTDYARPPMQTYAGGREVATLSAELTHSLNSLSRRAGATLFMTLLAAFNVLLHRLSGQDDIIVGSPIANRPRAETENLIGLFLNNLALRSELSGHPSFLQLLSRVRQTALDAYANQDVPFERLIEELKPERDLSRTSIFQVYFNLFSFSDQIQLPGGDSRSLVDAWLQTEESLAKFDLTLYAGTDGDQLKLAFVYNSDLFTSGRVAEMMRQFTHLLSQVANQPGEMIGKYSLVTPATKALLPDPALPLNAHEPEAITTIVSRQALRHPDRTALVDAAQSWTYREVDSQSNQLANFLIANGIRQGHVVAIYAHRSAPLVTAIIGALKAGAAFTIIDPANPAPRSIDCLRAASPRALIQIENAGAPPELLDQFVASLDDCCRITLDERGEAKTLAAFPDEIPDVQIAKDDLAYIAFTSGSTGIPKGVMGRHGPLTLFTAWAKDEFDLNERDRFCVLSGLAHDPLHRDIFTPLQLGGTICIPDPRDLEAPAQLRAWMRRQQITIANLTPAMAQLLCEEYRAADEAQLTSLRYSFLVGDVLTQRDVAKLKQLAPSATCVNLYGATETQRAVGYCVASTMGRQGPKQVLPLGRGIRDVQLLVLSPSQELCGIGELGEIYFRSPHLAKGYLKDDALTLERFIGNPFTSTTGDRLYRTGDLGRYLPDGNVEHAGRADRQIKIRGYRIEPGEIEAAIARTGYAREVVVTAEKQGGANSLAAYIVPATHTCADPGALRDALIEKLPAYMIPQRFVVLESLPLTPNRKLDRAALAALGQKEILISDRETKPGTAVEEKLAGIWQSVLEIPQLGIHENFFELGGHSLIAVRLFAIIEKEFGKRLPLATLFRAPTVAQLATLLERQSETEFSSLVPIQSSGTRAPFFCVHAVGGNVLEYHDLARHLGMDQPFYGLQSRGLNGEAPHTSIVEMAEHYIHELRQVQPDGPYFLGGRSLGGIIAYEMACQLRAAGQEVALLALLDSYPVGYQRLSADAGSARARARQFTRRVAAHVANIRSLSRREKLSYIAGKSKYGPVRVKSKLWRAIYRSYQNLGRELPRALKDVEEFNWLAAQSYRPQVYDGRVTLFWASKDLRAKFDMIAGWQTLARGGLELVEVSGTHLDMIKEPHVWELAQKLDVSLTKAGGQ